MFFSFNSIIPYSLPRFALFIIALSCRYCCYCCRWLMSIDNGACSFSSPPSPLFSISLPPSPRSPQHTFTPLAFIFLIVFVCTLFTIAFVGKVPLLIVILFLNTCLCAILLLLFLDYPVRVARELVHRQHFNSPLYLLYAHSSFYRFS